MSNDKMREAFDTRWRRNVRVPSRPSEEPALKYMFNEFESGWQAATASIQHQLAECQALLKAKDDALKTVSELRLPDITKHIIRKALAQTSGTEALDKLIAEAEQRGYDKCWNTRLNRRT